MNKEGRTAMLMTLIQPITAAWSHESGNQCAVCAFINAAVLAKSCLVLVKWNGKWKHFVKSLSIKDKVE